MTTELVTGRVWSRLIATRRKAPQRAWIAVAYLGKGAAKLLGLKSGSRLVVDASDNAVKSGQTCPADLLKLQDKGVRVFNYPHLHGKVYVFGRVAAVGSANASRNSAETLVEAMVLTTDRRVVKDAKAFVESIAKNEIGPDELDRLQKMYRPPRRPFAGARRKGQRRKLAQQKSLPNIRVVHLVTQKWSDQDWNEQEAGEAIAKRRREHRRSWKTDDFRWSGAHSFQRHDKVMMVTRESSGKRLVHPPGTVLYVRSYRTRNGRAAVVFLELPARRRRELRTLARAQGRGAMKRLSRGGTLRGDLSESLYDLWSA
jgi:hypothetical protein